MRTLLSLGSRAVAMGMTILLTLVVTRHFGVEGMDRAGSFFVAFTTLYLVATFARFGAETIALRLTAADPVLGRPWAGPASWLSLWLGIPGALVTGMLVGLQPAVREMPDGWAWAALFATTIVPVNLLSLAGAWLRAVGRVALGSYLELGGIATPVVAGVLAAGLAGDRSLASVLLIFTVSAWTVGLGSWLLGRRLLREAAPDADRETVRSYLKRFGRPLLAVTLTAVGFYCYAYLGTLYLGALHREGDAARFNLARTLANFVGLLATLQTSMLSPQFAALQHAKDLAGLRRVSWRATTLATGFGALVAVPLAVWPAQILGLVGKGGYADAAGTLRVLAIAWLVITAFGQVYSLLLTGDGMEKLAGRITFAALGVALVAMVAATPLGLTWIAGASMLAPLVFAVAGWVVLARRGIASAVWQAPH